ncbi:MAG TPA: cobaltochelatase subunit CobN, partial [Pyrinomonadaceae bacterium]|nr:cobaltochelatase subunit CobN [Pyrinomonadaceae bacterium]
MKITALIVGSSLLGPLRRAEEEINRRHGAGLSVRAYNLGAPLDEAEWASVERDLGGSEVVFVIHVTDGENASRLIELLRRRGESGRAVVVINCMPELMRLTRMGGLSFGAKADPEGGGGEGRARRLLKGVGSWMGEQARARRKGSGHKQYLRLVERMPALLRFVPNAGRLRDLKHYLYLFCYFLQPTPSNIASMLLYALKHYGGDARLSDVKVPPPESVPAVGVYHPEAPDIFESFEAYRRWHDARARRAGTRPLEASKTVGLLLMRTNVVSGTRRHYDALVRAVEREGLAVLPVISTFMDNRDACAQFFVGEGKPRVSQIVSLTGFSFVGGPAMNDSEAAVEFLKGLNVPLRSAVSLDVQTIESWQESWTGLNPVQAGMQVA